MPNMVELAFPSRNELPSLPNLDGRTKVAKRLAALETAFAGALGGALSPIQTMLVARAARNVLFLEIDQARALAGDQSVTEEQLTRRDNTARRSIVDLNLPSAAGIRQAENIDDILNRVLDEGATP
jgi:hypothetical protein